MLKKRAHSFEELMKPIMESQQSKMNTTDEEVLQHKPDRDVVERLTREVLFKLKEIHKDVRDLQRDLAYVTSQVDDLESEDR
jgi:hypothetical protein